MTKEFQYFSHLKLDSSVVTSCTKTDGKMKSCDFLGRWLGTILSFRRNNQGTLLPWVQQAQWYYAYYLIYSPSFRSKPTELFWMIVTVHAFLPEKQWRVGSQSTEMIVQYIWIRSQIVWVIVGDVSHIWMSLWSLTMSLTEASQTYLWCSQTAVASLAELFMDFWINSWRPISKTI